MASGWAKARDDETLETERGSCDNSYCPCANCPCGKGCRCTPLSVPRVITTSTSTGGNAVDVGDGVQFACTIQGMTCAGCATSVKNAILSSTPDVLDVMVDLSSARAFVALSVVASDPALAAEVRSVLGAIEDVGFEAELDASSLPEGAAVDLHAPESASKATQEEDVCGICLETLVNPIYLPCGHTFSAECLDVWRSKYDAKLVRAVSFLFVCVHSHLVMFPSHPCLFLLEPRSPKRRARSAGKSCRRPRRWSASCFRGGGHNRSCTCPCAERGQCSHLVTITSHSYLFLLELRSALQSFEREGDVHGAEYRLARSQVEELEAAIGSCAEVMESGTEEECIDLPGHVTRAAMENNVKRVLDWTRAHNADENGTCDGNHDKARQKRLDAHDPRMMNITLLHAAAANGHVGLATVLLQRGASVDAVDANGQSPLQVKSVLDAADGDGTVPLLLQWGAAVPAAPSARRALVREAAFYGNVRVAALLASEFGGRRCEIVDVTGTDRLNGKMCVVKEYLTNRNAYKVVCDHTEEVFLVDPRNLRRSDRTPKDPGYYVTFDKGRLKRHNFASREYCQAFVASLTSARDEGLRAKAETRANEAAAALLSELSLEDSTLDTAKSSKGSKKKKKKKKGGKKKA